MFTLYAGMKYLGDSLVGLRYTENNVVNIDSVVPITDLVKNFPAGDPTFLNTEFPFQPVFEFLKKQKRFELCDFNNIEPLGKGWAWGDYMADYMTSRNSFPMYKNIIDIKSCLVRWVTSVIFNAHESSVKDISDYFLLKYSNVRC